MSSHSEINLIYLIIIYIYTSVCVGNLIATHIYVLQVWVCTSIHLNLYRVEQINIHVLHVIFCPTWCPTCIVSSRTRVFIYLKVEQLKCLFVHYESWRLKLKFEAKFRIQSLYIYIMPIICMCIDLFNLVYPL